MGRMRLGVRPDAARQYVDLQLEDDGKPLGRILFDGASAEKHIRDVGRARAALLDPVTPDLDPGARVDVTVDPRWVIGDRTPVGRQIALRHPGLGWLAFIIPDDEAKAIADWLMKD